MTERLAGRRLVIVLGDQLDEESALLKRLDPSRDVVLMMEVEAESRHVVTHVQRTVFFLSAMRHFAEHVRARGLPLRYVSLDDPDNTGAFDTELERAAAALGPSEIHVIRPGSWRVLRLLEQGARRSDLSLTVHEDDHFLSTPSEFAAWASGRKTLTMEYFYREMRKRHGILVDGSGEPEGGRWNYDDQNRNAFKNPPQPPAPWRPDPDEITGNVLTLVKDRLPWLAGSAAIPRWPVTRPAARAQLAHFVEHALPDFGQWQDAMWTGDSLLWHSHLAPALNVKLLRPDEAIEAAVAAYRSGHAPLSAVEGFVRQILGWREFMRGIYWTQPETYRDGNALHATRELPEAYWSGKSPMVCLREAVTPVLDSAYSHHIQRLMVTGNLALTAGVHPGAVRDWYLGMFADGVDWVTTPNVVGMALYADDGLVGTKPYAAGGAYVNRMSNYCGTCAFDPKKRTGPKACPLTTLYWDFLDRNRERLAGNHRMGMMLKNLDRMDGRELDRIRERAGEVIEGLAERPA